MMDSMRLRVLWVLALCTFIPAVVHTAMAECELFRNAFTGTIRPQLDSDRIISSRLDRNSDETLAGLFDDKGARFQIYAGPSDTEIFFVSGSDIKKLLPDSTIHEVVYEGDSSLGTEVSSRTLAIDSENELLYFVTADKGLISTDLSGSLQSSIISTLKGNVDRIRIDIVNNYLLYSRDDSKELLRTDMQGENFQSFNPSSLGIDFETLTDFVADKNERKIYLLTHGNGGDSIWLVDYEFTSVELIAYFTAAFAFPDIFGIAPGTFSPLRGFELALDSSGKVLFYGSAGGIGSISTRRRNYLIERPQLFPRTNQGGAQIVSYNLALHPENDDCPLPGQKINSFDSSRTTDTAVFRPSIGYHLILTQDSEYIPIPWGTVGDVPVRIDRDGDKILDLAVFRPSTGHWYICPSSKQFDCNQFESKWFGAFGDIPLEQFDADGDGKDDFAVFRPSTGQWWYLESSTNVLKAAIWGIPGQHLPVVGDFDGDDRDDLAAYSIVDSYWYILTQRGELIFRQLPNPAGALDHPVPSDVDGDGITDLVSYKTQSSEFIACLSSQNFDCSLAETSPLSVPQGKVVRGDFDGDSKDDYALWQAADGAGMGTWNYISSASGETVVRQWGLAEDIPNGLGVVDRLPYLGY